VGDRLASARGAIIRRLALEVMGPQLDFSNSHFGFARGSRLPMDTALAKVGIPLAPRSQR